MLQEVEETRSVTISVLAVERIDSPKLFALASVEVVIDGISFTIHGVRAVRDPGGTLVGLPTYRNSKGVWSTAISLPEEIKKPMANAVIEALLDEGLAKQRFEVKAG